MAIELKGRGYPLVIKIISDNMFSLKYNNGTPIYVTSGGVLSAYQISGTISTTTTATDLLEMVTLSSNMSATNVYVTALTGTNISATTISAETMTATNFSGTTAKMTEATGTVLCGATGATRFVFSQGGSATVGAQVTTANSFMQFYNGSTVCWAPCFTTAPTVS